MKTQAIQVICCFLMFSCNRPQEQKDTMPVAQKKASMTASKTQIVAGETLNVNIEGLQKNDIAILLIQHALMSAMIPIASDKVNTSIFLDSVYTSKKGVILIQLIQNQQLVSEKKVSIEANEPYEYIESYLGPRGVIVASGQKVMNVAVPTDKYDNPITEGIKVQYRYLRPNQQEEDFDVPITHLLSYHEIAPQQKVGKTLVGITCKNANSNEKEFSEEPDWAASLILENVDYQGNADNRQFFKVKTLAIKDQYNNLIADGTEVVFYAIDEAKNVSRYESQSINGVAEILVQNPAKSCRLRFYATCGDIISDEKKLAFKRVFQDFEARFDAAKGEIIVGAMRSNLQQYIPDATPVLFEFYQDNQCVAKAQQGSLKGFATLELNNILFKKGHYQVKIKAQEAIGNVEFDF